jgi:hypothetical protein
METIMKDLTKVNTINEKFKINGIDLDKMIEEMETTTVSNSKSHDKKSTKQDKKVDTVNSNSVVVRDEEDIIESSYTNLLNLAKLQNKYAQILIKGKSFVISRAHRGGIDLTDSRSFKEFYRYLHEDVVVPGNKAGLTKRQYATEEFMDSEDTRRYLGLTFNPRNDSNKSIWNLWEGFSVKAKKGDVSLFLKLVSSLCNHNEEHIKYFLDWMAHMVQKPWELPEVAVVLRGAPGTGKGTLLRILGAFTNHYLHLSSARPLVGNFNGILASAFLVFCDESIFGGDKQAEGTLKTLITEKEHSINEKNEKEFMIENYKRFIFASNEDWAAPVGTGDRRYFVLDCSDEYKGQTNENGFFWEINKAIVENNLIEAVFECLMTRDISKVNILKGFDTCTKFIYDLIADHTDLQADTISIDGNGTRWYRKNIYAEFLIWCNDHHVKHIPSPDEFGKTMNKIFKFTDDCENWRSNWKSRDKGLFYKVPSRKEAMNKFAVNHARSPVDLVFPEYKEMETVNYIETMFGRK